jgi:hypothetical protein
MKALSDKTWRGKRLFFFAFLGFFLLLASGRMDSGDANAELAGSMNLVETGDMGTSTPYTDSLVQSLFVLAPNGRYYEAHDIGNALLLVPAAYGGVASSALVARHSGEGSPSRAEKIKTLVAKPLGSLIETAWSAVACYYLLLLFSFCYRPRAALLLTALFVLATYYTAYFRTAWNVVPACNAVILLLYRSAKLIRTQVVRPWDIAAVAFWLGVASLFRFSLEPYIALGVLILLWNIRHKVSRKAVLAGVATLILLIIPTLIFNAIRTGSPLRPAGTMPQFQYQTSLTGNLLSGLFGLLLSPNRGLFVYSPLLILLIALPWYWRSIPPMFRLLLKAYLPGIFLYYLMIAKMVNWGAAGWGPRYLLPILPILFLGAGSVAYCIWEESRVKRLLLAVLVCIGFTSSISTLLVDYSNAVLQYPDPFSMTTWQPTQYIAVGRNLLLGFEGRPVALRPGLTNDDMSKLTVVFPDLLVVRVHHLLARRSAIAVTLLLLVYAGLLGFTIYYLWSSVKRQDLMQIESMPSAL